MHTPRVQRPTFTPPCLLPRALALLMAAVAAVAQAQEEGQPLRTWKDAQGKEMMARFVEVKGGVVVLQKENGAKIQMPMMRLSADDQGAVKDLVEQAKLAAAQAKEAAASAKPAGGAKPGAPEKAGKEGEKIALPESLATIAHLPGSTGGYDGFYAYKPKVATEPKAWPTLLVYPAHGGPNAEFERFKAAADEVGWLILFGNDGPGNEPEIRKRSADFMAKIPRYLPVDKKRYYVAGAGNAFGYVTQLFELEKKTPVAGLLATGGGGWAGPSFPKDAVLYQLSSAETKGRYSSAALHKKAGGKDGRLVYFKSGEAATASQVKEALVYLNARFFTTAAGKGPDYKAEREAFTAKLLKDMEDNLEFNPVLASELAGILEQSALLPDQLKKVKDAAKKLDANPELAKYHKFEKDFHGYIDEHLGKGYDEKKADDQLKKMAKDADKLAEKYKDVKSVDLALVKALAQKPLK